MDEQSTGPLFLFYRHSDADGAASKQENMLLKWVFKPNNWGTNMESVRD